MADELAKVILAAMHDHSGLLFEYAAEMRDKPPPNVEECIAAAVAAHLESPEVVERAGNVLVLDYDRQLKARLSPTVPIIQIDPVRLARAAIRAAVQGGE